MTRHLIHIGYPKTGSTYLQHWFGHHPQLRYLHGRIGGIDNVFGYLSESFDAAQPPWRVTSAEGFSVPNMHAGIDQSLRWEHPPWEEVAVAQRRTCKMLADMFPNAHILIVTRGFRSMALSGYSQYIRIGGEYSLEDTLLRPHLGTYEWNYDDLVDLYRAEFADRVIVMPYELMAEDADSFIRILEDRLSIQHCSFSIGRINPSLSPVELRWYPRISWQIKRVSGGKGWLWRLYARLIFRNRLGYLIRIANWLWPAPALSGTSISDETLRPLGMLASKLVEEPLYAPYRTEYQN